MDTINGILLNSYSYRWPNNRGPIPWNTPAAKNYQVRITPNDTSIKGDESRATVEIKVWHDPFDQAIKDFMDDPNKPGTNQYPGAQLGILQNGKLAYVQGYGLADTARNNPVTADSVFRIASVTKPITASAIYKLKDEGRLQLDDKVFSNGRNRGILEAFAPPKVDRAIFDITVQDLLSHLGGWDVADLATQFTNSHPGFDSPCFDPMFRSIQIAADLAHPKIDGPPYPAGQIAEIPGPPDTQQIVDYVLKNFKLTNVPGETFAYSNFGYAALGKVIEKVSEKHWFYQKYVNDNIFLKIGMKNTHFASTPAPVNGVCTPLPTPGEVSYYNYPDPNGEVDWCVFSPHRSGPMANGGFDLAAMVAAGGLVSNVTDLLRFEASMTGTSQVVPRLLKEQPKTVPPNTNPSNSFPNYNDKFPDRNIYFPALSTDTGAMDMAWDGNFPGTQALLVQYDVPSQPATATTPAVVAQHTGFAVLLNSRPLASGGVKCQAPPQRPAMMKALRNRLEGLSNQLRDWPTVDLFVQP